MASCTMCVYTYSIYVCRTLSWGCGPHEQQRAKPGLSWASERLLIHQGSFLCCGVRLQDRLVSPDAPKAARQAFHHVFSHHIHVNSLSGDHVMKASMHCKVYDTCVCDGLFAFAAGCLLQCAFPAVAGPSATCAR